MIPSSEVCTQNINFTFNQSNLNTYQNYYQNKIKRNIFNKASKINNHNNSQSPQKSNSHIDGQFDNQYFQDEEEFDLNLDIKCINHCQLDLMSVCEDCFCGVCTICIEEDHRNHKISEINQLNGQYIIDSFRSNQYPNIIAYKKSDKIVNEAVDHCFGLVESRHQSNLIRVHEKFKKLHQVLLDLESNVTMILESNHSDNEELYSKIKSQLQLDADTMDTIINRHNHCIENYNIFDMYDQKKEKQLLSIIKDTALCNQLIGKKKLNRFQPFLDNTIDFDQDLEDVFVESLGNFYNIESKEFKDKDNQHLMINKFSKGGNFNYYITHGEPVPDDITSLGLSNKINLKDIKIPDNIKELHFLNGFCNKIEAQLVPKGIQKIFFYDVVQPLVVGSIPISVKELYFCSGFSHTILPGVIPNSVIKMVLYDVKQPLLPGTITNSVQELHLNNGFNQFILPNVIPESVEKLFLYEIKQPLLSGCIPSTLKELYLRSGFNHPITPSIIPHSIRLLYIGDVKQTLNQGSIPFGIREIHFGNGFDQPITSDIIPSSVESLFLYNIKYPLSPSSIPNTIKELQFGNGFSHIIQPKTIPSNVNRLIIYSFKPPIIKGSIPHTVKELYLLKGVHSLIQKDFIPITVKNFNI